MRGPRLPRFVGGSHKAVATRSVSLKRNCSNQALYLAWVNRCFLTNTEGHYLGWLLPRIWAVCVPFGAPWRCHFLVPGAKIERAAHLVPRIVRSSPTSIGRQGRRFPTPWALCSSSASGTIGRDGEMHLRPRFAAASFAGRAESIRPPRASAAQWAREGGTRVVLALISVCWSDAPLQWRSMDVRLGVSLTVVEGRPRVLSCASVRTGPDEWRRYAI